MILEKYVFCLQNYPTVDGLNGIISTHTFVKYARLYDMQETLFCDG